MAIKLTLYSRSACHLCEDMEQHLASLSQDHTFSVQRIDIDDSAELADTYGSRVPVLMHGEHLICEYYLDQQTLLQLLNSE